MIYYVENDDDIRELVPYTLKTTGFVTQGFPNAELFWQAIESQKPDLILLDIMLPGSDGLSILEELKGKVSTADIPVIMVAAKGTGFDKVKGLDMGSGDYLVKPFGVMEMVSRIKAVLRRSQKSQREQILQVGNLSLDIRSYTIGKDGEDINLTLKESELLGLLMKYPNRILTRQRLLNQVWRKYLIDEARTVDVRIGTLHTRLGDANHLIETIRGVGYRLEEENG